MIRSIKLYEAIAWHPNKTKKAAHHYMIYVIKYMPKNEIHQKSSSIESKCTELPLEIKLCASTAKCLELNIFGKYRYINTQVEKKLTD